MGLFNSIKQGLTDSLRNSANINSITSGWNDLSVINGLSMPNFRINDLFKTVTDLNNLMNATLADPAKSIYRTFPELYAGKSTGGSVTSTDGDNVINRVVLGNTETKEEIVRDENGNPKIKKITYNKDKAKSGNWWGGTEIEYETQNVENTHGADSMELVTKFQPGFENNSGYSVGTVDTNDADRLVFQTMDWGYADFINERALWQKSLQNPLGERGWFYFKIFFNFDTQYGLLGGLLNNEDPRTATNTAFKYLDTCTSLGTYYKCPDRMIALQKFASILSYISTYAPWFFKSVKNLNQANVPLVDDFTKEKSIEIECNPDAIDMRLTTLLDLYKFACYDEMDLKEIVPDNLRKFDMTVMLFQAPLKYFHTAFTSKSGRNYEYKTANLNRSIGFGNTMSFKMFTFINCEIDRECLGNMIPGSVSNEQPFNMGGGSIKINYDRVYTHNMNEFMHLMIGGDGLYYDGSLSGMKWGLYNNTQDSLIKSQQEQAEAQRKRINDIAESMEKDSMIYEEVSKDPKHFKHIVDMSESLCSNNMRNLGFNALGNFYDTNDPQIDRSKKDISNKEFLDLKLAMIKNDVSLPAKLNYADKKNKFVDNLIDTYRNMRDSVYETWTTDGYAITTDAFNDPIIQANNQNGTWYFKQKLAQLKDGVAAPELLVSRTGHEPYERYRNTIKLNGYAEKNADSEYWRLKMKQLKDGIAAPETDVTRNGKWAKWDASKMKWLDAIYDESVMHHNNFGYGDKTTSTKYWSDKMKQLSDGIVAPETVTERYINQQYEENYSEVGNLNKALNTKYWETKMKQLTDGVAAPETVSERYVNQNYEQNYSTDGYGSKMQNSKYWHDKISEIKDGNIKGVYDNSSDAGSVHWENKMKQLTDNVVSPETVNERYINQVYDDNYSEQGYKDKNAETQYWREKTNQLKEGSIKNDYETPGVDNKLQEKMKQLTDNIAAPETVSERYIHQKYENNFTEQGYSDTGVGSLYWDNKLNDLKNGTIKGEHEPLGNNPNFNGKLQQITDGVVSPETVAERYVQQRYNNNYDEQGYKDTDADSQYWRNKAQNIKDGTIKGEYNDMNDAGSNYWKSKTDKMNDGKANP